VFRGFKEILGGILASFLHTLYLWTVAFVSSLSLSFSDFLVRFSLSSLVYLGAPYAFNKTSLLLIKKKVFFFFFFLFYLKNRISNRLIMWISSEIFIISCEDSQHHL